LSPVNAPEACKRKVSERDLTERDKEVEAHRIISARVPERTGERAGERGVIDLGKSGGTVPIDVYGGADKSATVLPVLEGESVDRSKQSDGTKDSGGGEEHGWTV